MKARYLSLAVLALQTPAFAQNNEAVAPTAAEAPAAEAPADEAPADEAPAASEDEAAGEAEEAPAEPAPAAEDSSVQPAPIADETAEEDTAAATNDAPVEQAAVAADEEEDGATINPRPAGEEELFGKHPVKNEKNTFKPGTGLTFYSEDEKFSMGIRLRVQFRDELVSEEDDAGERSLANTFGIRRARLQFKGNMFGKDVKYKAEFALSPRDLSVANTGVPGNTPLLSWYTDFTHFRDLSLRVGQYKLLYSRQRVISSGDQEFVDRNIAQNEFNVDRDIGFHLFSQDLFGLNMFRYYAGATIGEGRDVWRAEPTDSSSYQLLARVEYLPFGDFEDYSEVDFERLDKFRLSFGAAYAYLNRGARVRGYQGSAFADGGTADYNNATADLMIKWAGMTIYSDFFYRHGHRNETVAPGDEAGNLVRNGLGGSVQVGYLIPKIPVGVGVRYGGLTSAGMKDSALSKKQEVGATAGWYIAGHNLKLQADYFHTWGDSFTAEAVDEGRLQLQVAY